MCYKSPGPRCYTHASQDVQKLQSKFDAAAKDHEKLIEEYNGRLLTYLKHDKQDGDDFKLAKKNYLEIQKEVDANDKKMAGIDEKLREAKLSANATPPGIEQLKEKLHDVRDRGYGGEFVELELDQAKERYEKNMEDYDRENGTVYGRKPSDYASEEGLKTLEDRYEKADNRIDNILNKEAREGVSQRDKLLKAVVAKRRIDDQIKHAERTIDRMDNKVIPDARVIKSHLDQAAQKTKEANDSWERSDTDGYMSQWASGVMAEHHRMRAELEKNGGKAEFQALFDKDGNMVPAKRLTVADRYNGGQPKEVWGILEDPKDPNSGIKEWVNDSKAKGFDKKEAAMAKKGYSVGLVRAPAYVAERGANLVNVRSVFVRADGGYNPDAEVVTKNIYPKLIQEDKEREAQNRANMAAAAENSKREEELYKARQKEKGNN